MPSRNKPGCNCCTDCEFFSDGFNRADGDDPGEYTEVSGDWDISSTALVTASANAVLTCDTQQPDGDPYIAVTVTATVDTVSSTRDVKIILGFVDSSNYWYVRLRTSGTRSLSIIERSGGVDTTRKTLTITTLSTTFTLCASYSQSGYIMGRLLGSGNELRIVRWEATLTEPVCGLGTGTTGGATISFDNLTASKVSEDCPSCGQPCTGCSDGEGPSELKVVIPTGTFEFTNVGVPGFDHCDEPSCTDGEGTYYLPICQCVSHMTTGTGYGNVATLCAATTVTSCAYHTCAVVPCAAGNHVLRSLSGVIYPSAGNTVLEVWVAVRSETVDGVFNPCPDSIFGSHWHAIFAKTFSGLVDCGEWLSESVGFSSRSVHSNDTHCWPSTSSTVEVSAVA